MNGFTTNLLIKDLVINSVISVMEGGKPTVIPNAEGL